MGYRHILYPQLYTDEGKRNGMYQDSLGVETIGVGHNLRDRPISDRAVQVILEDDVEIAERDARRVFKNFDSLSEARQAVVVNMAFNLGATRLSSFRFMIRAVTNGKWQEAAEHMRDSLWAAQVGERANRLAEAMLRG